jgi:hypothetical protein
VATVAFTGPPAPHIVRVTVRGDKNPESTSAMVGLDYAEVTFEPASDPED